MSLLLDMEEGVGLPDHLTSGTCWEAQAGVLTAETGLRVRWGCMGGTGPEPVTTLHAPLPSRVS